MGDDLTTVVLSPFTLESSRWVIKSLYFIAPLFIVYLGWRLIKIMGCSREMVLNTLKDKKVIIAVGGYILCLTTLNLFFGPKLAIDQGYGIKSASVSFMTTTGNANWQVSDPDKIENLRRLIVQYPCRASIYEELPKAKEKIMIDFVPTDSTLPTLHFMLTESKQIRYTDINSDYIYAIDDRQNKLYHMLRAKFD